MSPIAVPHTEVAGLSASVKTQSNLSVLSEAPLVFANTDKERSYVKEQLALAIRIFGRLGYDEGVAGHITYAISMKINRQFAQSDKKFISTWQCTRSGRSRMLLGGLFRV